MSLYMQFNNERTIRDFLIKSMCSQRNSDIDQPDQLDCVKAPITTTLASPSLATKDNGNSRRTLETTNSSNSLLNGKRALAHQHQNIARFCLCEAYTVSQNERRDSLISDCCRISLDREDEIRTPRVLTATLSTMTPTAMSLMRPPTGSNGVLWERSHPRSNDIPGIPVAFSEFKIGCARKSRCVPNDDGPLPAALVVSHDKIKEQRNITACLFISMFLSMPSYCNWYTRSKSPAELQSRPNDGQSMQFTSESAFHFLAV